MLPLQLHLTLPVWVHDFPFDAEKSLFAASSLKRMGQGHELSPG